MKIRHLAFILIAGLMVSCHSGGPTYVTIKTEFGDMKVELYDSTPKHKENFLKLIDEGFYKDLLFHRVIQGFMVQGGDPNSKDAGPNAQLGSGGPGYKIDAEIGLPHFKGTLAAARQGGPINPKKQSSGSQFYLVQGRVQTDAQLNQFEQRGGFKYNEAQRNKYKTIGGTPALDNDYTVFGEVVEGLDVIDKIAAVQTGNADRPVKDVKMDIVR
ncbi:MAG: peptidylprolyl isomerase [Bacteroidota bacterium]